MNITILSSFMYASRHIVLVEIDNQYRTCMYYSSGYNSTVREYLPFAGLKGPNELPIAKSFPYNGQGWLVKAACWTSKNDPTNLQVRHLSGSFTNATDRLTFDNCPFSFQELSEQLKQVANRSIYSFTIDYKSSEDIGLFNTILTATLLEE